jgi:hypothetical protein
VYDGSLKAQIAKLKHDLYKERAVRPDNDYDAMDPTS